MFAESIQSYGPDGNILTLQRKGIDALMMDDFSYTYQSGKNRLASIKNAVNSQTYNYTYDNNGNVTSDQYRGISNITYNINNLPEELLNSQSLTVQYTYDENNNRIRKLQSNSDDEYYILGANGETEAVFYANGIVKFYNITNGNEIIGRMTPPVNNLTLTNTTLVGNYQASSTITAETNVVVNGTATLKTPGTIYLKPGFTANSGCNLTISIGAVKTDKYYYLKDHLGSVRVVVDTVGEIVSYSDYNPWGMILNGRSSNFGFADDKYKFTGKERDVETGYDYFGARYYDSRIGRMLSIDPHSSLYPSESPYEYALSNPLITIDPDGRDTLYFNQNGSYSGRYSKGGDNIGYITDKNGKTTRSFSFLDPTDVTSLESTRDANGNLLDQKYWETNGDRLFITGLNLNVENFVDPIVGLSISGAQGLNFGSRLGFIAAESLPGGSMDFTFYKNPLGSMLKTSELAVIGGMSYNRFDAGNYFWGVAMIKFGFSPTMAQSFARLYERIFKGRKDQIYDQTAIWNGATRVKK